MPDISAQIAMEIERLMTTPSGERLQQIERDKGYKVIRPGDAPWFSAADWLPMTIASTDGRRVRLVALAAVNPGHGALLRLVIAILAAGLDPVIVEPHEALQATLRRWGWKSRRVGKGFEAHWVWYPRRGLFN